MFIWAIDYMYMGLKEIEKEIKGNNNPKSSLVTFFSISIQLNN